jgi:hypothetical protein
MTIVSGYDGSRHAPTSDLASKVKKDGHKKEEIFAQRLGDINYVVRGQKKPDVIKGNARYSVKGATKNIQLLLSRLNRSAVAYGVDCPMYQYHLAAYHHKHFKMNNGNEVDTDLFDAFYNAGLNVAEWLRDKNNFRIVLEKVFSDNYDANKLVVLKKFTDDALVYDMKDVIDLYVNSDYEIHVTLSKCGTRGGKVVVRAENKEIFYLEVRGSKHCGEMNHGVRSSGLYDFIKENLTYEVVFA